jgi:hypothetical protein
VDRIITLGNSKQILMDFHASLMLELLYRKKGTEVEYLFYTRDMIEVIGRCNAISFDFKYPKGNL